VLGHSYRPPVRFPYPPILAETSDKGLTTGEFWGPEFWVPFASRTGPIRESIRFPVSESIRQGGLLMSEQINEDTDSWVGRFLGRELAKLHRVEKSPANTRRG
jgi:hypothetical protein